MDSSSSKTKTDPIGDGLRSVESLLAAFTRSVHRLPDLTHPLAVQYATSDELVGDIEPGDHIAVRCSKQPHYHHGVYVGRIEGKSGIWVVDLHGNKKNDSTVRARKWSEFVKGCDVFVKIVWVEPPHTLEESVQAALYTAEFVERNSVEGVYHVEEFNCETFATWCRTGWYASALPAALTSAMDGMLPMPPPPVKTGGYKSDWSWWLG